MSRFWRWKRKSKTPLIEDKKLESSAEISSEHLRATTRGSEFFSRNMENGPLSPSSTTPTILRKDTSLGSELTSQLACPSIHIRPSNHDEILTVSPPQVTEMYGPRLEAVQSLVAPISQTPTKESKRLTELAIDQTNRRRSSTERLRILEVLQADKLGSRRTITDQQNRIATLNETLQNIKEQAEKEISQLRNETNGLKELLETTEAECAALQSEEARLAKERKGEEQRHKVSMAKAREDSENFQKIVTTGYEETAIKILERLKEFIAHENQCLEKDIGILENVYTHSQEQTKYKKELQNSLQKFRAVLE